MTRLRHTHRPGRLYRSPPSRDRLRVMLYLAFGLHRFCRCRCGALGFRGDTVRWYADPPAELVSDAQLWNAALPGGKGGT